MEYPKSVPLGHGAARCLRAQTAVDGQSIMAATAANQPKLTIRYQNLQGRIASNCGG
jgi:hypothetical protein